jgi:hypothetical protein
MTLFPWSNISCAALAWYKDEMGIRGLYHKHITVYISGGGVVHIRILLT